MCSAFLPGFAKCRWKILCQSHRQRREITQRLNSFSRLKMAVYIYLETVLWTYDLPLDFLINKKTFSYVLQHLFHILYHKMLFLFPSTTGSWRKIWCFSHFYAELDLDRRSDAEVLEHREAMTNMPHKFGTDDFWSTYLSMTVCTPAGHWKTCRVQYCWKDKIEIKVGFCIRLEK